MEKRSSGDTPEELWAEKHHPSGSPRDSLHSLPIPGRAPLRASGARPNGTRPTPASFTAIRPAQKRTSSRGEENPSRVLEAELRPE